MAAMFLDRTVWSLSLFSTVKTRLGYDVCAAQQHEQRCCKQKGWSGLQSWKKKYSRAQLGSVHSIQLWVRWECEKPGRQVEGARDTRKEGIRAWFGYECHMVRLGIRPSLTFFCIVVAGNGPSVIAEP